MTKIFVSFVSGGLVALTLVLFVGMPWRRAQNLRYFCDAHSGAYKLHKSGGWSKISGPSGCPNADARETICIPPERTDSGILQRQKRPNFGVWDFGIGQVVPVLIAKPVALDSNDLLIVNFVAVNTSPLEQLKLFDTPHRCF